MSDSQQICGAVDELDYSVWFECELPVHHDGDHQAVHAWQNEPHGPKKAPMTQVQYQWLRTVMDEINAEHTRLLLSGSAFADRDKVLKDAAQRIVARAKAEGRIG